MIKTTPCFKIDRQIHLSIGRFYFLWTMQNGYKYSDFKDSGWHYLVVNIRNEGINKVAILLSSKKEKIFYQPWDSEKFDNSTGCHLGRKINKGVTKLWLAPRKYAIWSNLCKLTQPDKKIKILVWTFHA